MRALNYIQNRRAAKHVAEWGMLVAVAFVLSYVEAILSLGIRLPGVKLGLCHLVTLYALYRMKPADVWMTGLVRVVMTGMLFGNAMTFIYGGFGTICSLAVMLSIRKCKCFSAVGVSVAGGAVHNIGQIFCASLLLETSGLIWYLPLLLITGTISGGIIGRLGCMMTKRFP